MNYNQSNSRYTNIHTNTHTDNHMGDAAGDGKDGAETDILSGLNPDQREAVLYFDSPLLVIAGAGSGKTRVITNKIAYLIREKDMPPRNILGVTFTNKAASEMKSRIRDLTGIDARYFNISTFHSLGLRMLRESGGAMGMDAEWQVIDDQDQKKIIERIIKDNFSYFTSDMRDMVRRKIGFAKMDLNYPNNKEFLYQKGFNDDEVRIFTLYYNFQKANKVWDYEDLISLPVKMLQMDEEVRAKYQDRFKYVVVDEFQDTNPNQYQLLKLIAGGHKKITIVGDDDQAVYSWRGASIRFLFNFEQDFPGSHIIKLEQNYRSTPQVLDYANHLISKNTTRRHKNMWTDEKDGSPVYILNTRSKEEEASHVATLINRLKTEKADVFPLAILYRINSQSLAFETEFARRNIPFKILKGLRFFDRKEIKDSMAMLKLAVNPNDDISFLRVVDFLSLGVGSKTLATLSDIARDHQLFLFPALREHMPEKFNGKDFFRAMVKLHREYREKEIKLSELLDRSLHASGYSAALEEKGEQDRLLNIRELREFIVNWETESPGEDFSQLMDRVTLDTDDRSDNKNQTQVFLLTMHNAKGLEFPTVVAAGINSSYMPFFLRKGDREIQEERRLFYVASTRAIKQLVISTGSERPSPFLSQVRASLYSTAYSVEDIVEYWMPEDSRTSIISQWEKTKAAGNLEEKFLEHPVFGRGKIINHVGDDKYIVDFVDRGEKTIDTGIVPVTFL